MIKRDEKEIMSKWNIEDIENPVVTVNCMTFNHERYIAEALDSFLMQETDFVFEILVHDDASTDNTAKIIKEYEIKFPHIIKPIYQTVNQYSKHDGTIRRIMSEKARGKYTAFCEGDDYWTDPYKLKKQIDYMEEHPECSMTFHAMNFTKNDRVIGNDRRYSIECDVPARDIIIGGGIFCATASLCFKSEYYALNTEFRDVCDVGDYPLQILFLTKGTVHYFPEIMGVYRRYVEGAWTTRVNKRRDLQEHHHKSVIESLRLYDIYSDYKFSDAVKYTIILEYIELYNEMFIEKKEVLEQLKIIDSVDDKKKLLRKLKKTEIKVFVKNNFPRVYTMMQKIKRR